MPAPMMTIDFFATGVPIGVMVPPSFPRRPAHRRGRTGAAQPVCAPGLLSSARVAAHMPVATRAVGGPLQLWAPLIGLGGLRGRARGRPAATSGGRLEERVDGAREADELA